ncbi:hypothetical protein chiPu_0002714 [Chiloscyllium punctatum]|uniref:Uncharacterized protein n=1 Tax=Chiloscyllium punctatum TaxID=137246 RepID=A0A401S1N6_CHIPU|nr:hypothetical protein [Chiloscyllium punctatum]
MCPVPSTVIGEVPDSAPALSSGGRAGKGPTTAHAPYIFSGVGVGSKGERQVVRLRCMLAAGRADRFGSFGESEATPGGGRVATSHG